MNGIQLHLLFNHLPIMATYIAIPLLIISLFKKRDIGFHLAILIILIIGGAGALVSQFSGEAAEDIAKHLTTVSPQAIVVHEEWAEWTSKISAVVALIAGVRLVLIIRKKPEAVTTGFTVLLLAAVMVAAVFMAVTGHSGGKIHHEELRKAITNQTPQIQLKNHDLEDDD